LHAESVSDVEAGLESIADDLDIAVASAPRLFAVFGFTSAGDPVPFSKHDVLTIANMATSRAREEDDDPMEEGDDDQPSRLQSIQAPMLWIGTARLRDTVGQVSRMKTSIFTTHTVYYQPHPRAGFKKSDFDAKPLVTLTLTFPKRGEDSDHFDVFKRFTRIKKPLDWYQESADGDVDWSGGDCGVSHKVLEQLLKPTVKDLAVTVINVWGGGNITEIAMVSISYHLPYTLPAYLPLHSVALVACLPILSAASRYAANTSALFGVQRNGRPVIEFVRDPADVDKGHDRVKGMNFLQVEPGINPPAVDLHRASRHEGAVASSSGAQRSPSPGTSGASPPHPGVAHFSTPPDPVSAGSRHRGRCAPRRPPPSPPRSPSPPGVEPLSGGPRGKDILHSSVSGHDPLDQYGGPSQTPSRGHAVEGSGLPGLSEESHGGGGPSTFPVGPDVELRDLVAALGARGLLGPGANVPSAGSRGAQEAGPSSMRVDLHAPPEVDVVTRLIPEGAAVPAAHSTPVERQDAGFASVFTRRATSVGGQPTRPQVAIDVRRGRSRGSPSALPEPSPDSRPSRGRSSASLGPARTPARSRASDVTPEDVHFPLSAAELDSPNEALSPSAEDTLHRPVSNQG
jgi:hypothetical protein